MSCINLLPKGAVKNAVTKVIRFLWGDLTPDELKRFWRLSTIFFVLIGVYWFIRVMKDPVFSLLVGYKYQPFAKIVSLFVVVGAVLLYSKLVDLLKKNVLFYLICSFFGLSFLGLGYVISHPGILSTATGSTLSSTFSFIPGSFLGWFIYCFIESFGSIVPALFLAIVASTMSTELAKKGYGMIYAFGQLGVILGTGFVASYVKTLGFGILFAMGGIFIGILPFLMKWYMTTSPIAIERQCSSSEQKPKTGILEGLRLLLSRPYIAGLFVVTTMYEVIGTIVEFQMGLCATETYGVSAEGIASFAWLKAMNGMSVGILSLAFALFGTSFLMRRLGLKFCIISYPTMIGITIATIFGFYCAGASLYFLMWAFFCAVVLFKGLSYTLNNPSKEVMYIPTSNDVKFKAKGWIDGFGSRAAKSTGALVTGSLGANLSALIVFGSVAALGIVAFWVFVAAYVGNTFNKLQAENKIVE
jgi:AAA family ATP:ADP antiporter